MSTVTVGGSGSIPEKKMKIKLGPVISPFFDGGVSQHFRGRFAEGRQFRSMYYTEKMTQTSINTKKAAPIGL